MDLEREPGLPPPVAGSPLSRSRRLGRGAHRDREVELGAVVGGMHDRHVAAVGDRDLLNDRQAEP